MAPAVEYEIQDTRYLLTSGIRWLTGRKSQNFPYPSHLSLTLSLRVTPLEFHDEPDAAKTSLLALCR